MIIKKKNTQVYALGQHISMSTHKARKVVDQIHGRSYKKTLIILELMPYRACYPIFKLVYSTAGNASHNMDFKKGDLIGSKAKVNEGTTIKKIETLSSRTWLSDKTTYLSYNHYIERYILN